MASSSKHMPAEISPEVQDLYCFTETNGVITSTMNEVPGYRVTKVLGTVYGITVRSRNVGTSLGMAFKSLAGGELRWFTSLLYTARNDAVGRVADECLKRGGNAIIALRFDAGDMGGYAQVCAYGTAALVEKVDPESAVPECPQLVSGGAGAPAR